MGETELRRDELNRLLERLEAEEREVSALRRKLHDRLASFENAETERHERELSARRKELHDEMDRVRAEQDRLRTTLKEQA
jgi:hypothetical protein